MFITEEPPALPLPADQRIFCAVTRGKAAAVGEVQLDVMTQRSDVRVVLTSRAEQALGAIGGGVALLSLLLDPAHGQALAPPPDSKFLQQEDGAAYLPIPPRGGLRRACPRSALSSCGFIALLCLC